MEMNVTETKVLEKAVNEAVETQTNELDNLQLALVGGGIGSVIFV